MGKIRRTAKGGQFAEQGRQIIDTETAPTAGVGGHGVDCAPLENLAHESGENGFGADLDKNPSAGLEQGFNLVDEIHRVQQVIPENGFDLIGVAGVGAAGRIGQNLDFSGTEAGCLQGRGKGRLGVLHQTAVKGGRHG